MSLTREVCFFSVGGERGRGERERDDTRKQEG